MIKEFNNKLSVVVITKNNDNLIRGFLESVKFADEVVVIDDESTDKTREICKEYGAKIIVNKSELQFDKQRNIGIDKADNDWIMQMDADEIVSVETVKRIKEALGNLKGQVAFSIVRKDYFKNKCLKNCGMQSNMVKIFNRNFARYKELGRRHEFLDIKGKLGYINAVVDHYPYKGVIDFLNKQLYYADHEARRILREKGRLSWSRIRYNLIIKPIKLFWKLHFKKKGYKDGAYGFIWNLLQAIRRMILWMRYWEILEGNNEN